MLLFCVGPDVSTVWQGSTRFVLHAWLIWYSTGQVSEVAEGSAFPGVMYLFWFGLTFSMDAMGYGSPAFFFFAVCECVCGTVVFQWHWWANKVWFWACAMVWVVWNPIFCRYEGKCQHSAAGTGLSDRNRCIDQKWSNKFPERGPITTENIFENMPSSFRSCCSRLVIREVGFIGRQNWLTTLPRSW